MAACQPSCLIPALFWCPAITATAPEPVCNRDANLSFFSFSYHHVELEPAATTHAGSPYIFPASVAPGAGAEVKPSAALAKRDKHVDSNNSPFSAECKIPMPSLATHGSQLLYYEPVFVRRRNERERQRVRYVNDGYNKLRLKLPSHQKRMSKVDILRGAIDYIRALQEVLNLPKTSASQLKHTRRI